MTDTLAARIEYSLLLADHPDAVRTIAEILTRPCFHRLVRVCAEAGTRWTKHTRASARVIAEYLLDRTHDGIILDSGRGDDTDAMGAVSNGQHEQTYRPADMLLEAYVHMPLEPDRVAEAVSALCDLAVALDARSGAVSAEPDDSTGHDFGIARRPKPRPIYSEARLRERRMRQLNDELIATQVAGPEWGLFLGPGHLERIDPDALAASGAFERVVRLAPGLVFLQLTADPADALSGAAFDDKLDRARGALAPVLMDPTTARLD